MIRTVLLPSTANRLSMMLNSHQIAGLALPSEAPAAPTIQRFEFKRQEPAKTRAIQRQQERRFKQLGQSVSGF